jgi:hypothetical protein
LTKSNPANLSRPSHRPPTTRIKIVALCASLILLSFQSAAAAAAVTASMEILFARDGLAAVSLPCLSSVFKDLKERVDLFLRAGNFFFLHLFMQRQRENKTTRSRNVGK